MAFVKITYPREKWERAPQAAAEVIVRNLGDLTSGVAGWIYDRAPDDTSVARNSLGFRVDSLGRGSFRGSTYASAPYAQYALEFGRGPGKMPPPQNLIGWVQRRGLNSVQRGKIRILGRSLSRRLSLGHIGRGQALHKIQTATNQFGAATSAQKSIAFAVGKKIARKGVKALKLFTRAVRETRRSIQLPAIQRMATELVAVL